MMRRRTGLDANQTRLQLLKECQHIAPLELTSKQDFAFGIDAVNLENRLRDVETNSRGCFTNGQPATPISSELKRLASSAASSIRALQARSKSTLTMVAAITMLNTLGVTFVSSPWPAVTAESPTLAQHFGGSDA
jgi:hypothetical protein